ncbi:MAG TPA: hypothetical protein VEX37_01040 [Thermomicrobiales bacterium]|nr:hypothetical protein [Thermomicrobiales bacterium]
MATRAAAKPPAKPVTMTRRDFFSHLLEAVRRSLPPERQEFEARQTMNLLKISYGANYRIHFEAWINAERGYVELGLHFEDGPASTERLLRHFEASILELKDLLGPAIELERWTQSWGHIFELHPVEPLTPGFADRLAARLALQIVVLQPILDEAYELGYAPRTPHASTFHQRFRGRRG